MTLLKQIKHFVKNSAMEPVVRELYSYYSSLQRTWMNSAGPSLVANGARAFGVKYEIELPLHKQWVQVMRNSQLLLTNRPVATGPCVLFTINYGFALAMIAV